MYSAQPSHLFHNNRDGTFTDVTASAGLSSEFGPALGVVTADFNGDGWIDIYVTNDGQPNQMWINQHNGTFKNTGLLSGTALSGEGEAKSSMGVDAGDFDNDGDEDLVVTELTGQGSDLYVNDGSGIFVDQSARSRLRFASLPFTGFGAAWLDVDNDGWLDILTRERRGDQHRGSRARERSVSAAPAEAVASAISAAASSRMSRPVPARSSRSRAVGRGAAFGDVDNDGDVDVVVGNDNGPAELLINQIGNRRDWVGIRAVGGQGQGARHGRRARRCRPRRWRRCCGGGRGRTAATRRPTIRACWSDWGRPRNRFVCGSSGRMAGRKNGATCRSIGTPR